MVERAAISSARRKVSEEFFYCAEIEWVWLLLKGKKKAVCFRDNVFDKSLCLAVKEKNMQRQKAYRGSNHGAQHVPGR